MPLRSPHVLGLLLFSMAGLAGCESKRVSMTSASTQAPAVPPSATPTPQLLEQARSALANQDYLRCTNRFAAAALRSRDEEAASSWYRASQCAARGGDYRESRFHLQRAASAGFADLRRLRTDPLLRPMKSNARWQLIDDIVRKNQADRSLRLVEPRSSGEPAQLAQLESLNE